MMRRAPERNRLARLARLAQPQMWNLPKRVE